MLPPETTYRYIDQIAFRLQRADAYRYTYTDVKTLYYTGLMPKYVPSSVVLFASREPRPQGWNRVAGEASRAPRARRHTQRESVSIQPPILEISTLISSSLSKRDLRKCSPTLTPHVPSERFSSSVCEMVNDE